MGEPLQAVRWRRYGKDRLYVSAGDGVRVGWLDIVTGETTVEQPDLADDFSAAIDAWRAENPAVITSAAVGAPRTASIVAVLTDVQSPAAVVAAARRAEPSWTDLAEHVPGQLARKQADAELIAQRERSRVASFIARALDVKTDERAWRVGASGEETVGVRLDKLTKHGWHVLHAVPVGERGSDIDHVVIGHGGVYTLNTKTHPGGSVWVGKHQVRVNGHRTDYLRNSRHEAARAARLLTASVGFAVTVRPALVFLTGSLIPNVTIKERPDDVFIYDRMDVPRVFRRAPQRLTPDQVAAVFEHARRSTTWQVRAEAPGR